MSYLLSPPIETSNGILSPGLTTLPPTPATPATEAYPDPDLNTKWPGTSPTEELKEQILGDLEEERRQGANIGTVPLDELALLEEERAAEREASSAVSEPSDLLLQSDNSSIQSIISPTPSEKVPGTMKAVHISSLPLSSGVVDEGYYSDDPADDDEDELDLTDKEDIEEQRHEFLEAQIKAFDKEKKEKLREKLDNGGMLSPEEQGDAYDLGLSLPDDDWSPPSSPPLSDAVDGSTRRIASYDLDDDDDVDEDLFSDGEEPDSVATSAVNSPIPSPPESPVISPERPSSPITADTPPLATSAGNQVAAAILGAGQTFKDLQGRSLEDFKYDTIAKLNEDPDELASVEFREATDKLLKEVSGTDVEDRAVFASVASEVAQDMVDQRENDSREIDSRGQPILVIYTDS